MGFCTGVFTGICPLNKCLPHGAVQRILLSAHNRKQGEHFFKPLQYALYNEGAEVAIQTKRPWDSLWNRFQKTIGPTVQNFNGYFKQAVEQNESGWTKEMNMEAAMNVWDKMEGKPFKVATCTRILH